MQINLSIGTFLNQLQPVTCTKKKAKENHILFFSLLSKNMHTPINIIYHMIKTMIFIFNLLTHTTKV